MIKHFDRITIDPEICLGTPCIRRLRMPVSSILKYLASGLSVEEILEDWPDLEKEDIYQALDYAAWISSEKTIPIEISTGSK